MTRRPAVLRVVRKRFVESADQINGRHICRPAGTGSIKFNILDLKQIKSLNLENDPCGELVVVAYLAVAY
jgi:hypothetical protein